MRAIASSVFANVVAGARLALFLPVTPRHFHVYPGAFIALAMFNFIAALAAAMIRNGTPGAIDLGAIAVYFAQLSLVLAAAVALAAALRVRASMLSIATALLAADWLFEVVGTGLSFAAAGHQRVLWAASLAELAWAFIVAVRAVLIHTGWRGARLPAATAIVAALFAGLIFLFPSRELWNVVAENDETPAVESRLLEEPVFHRQQQLLGAALGGLKPQQPGVADLYFVGVAPYASEDVFARELAHVRKLFDERFATAGRSLVLVNSPETLEQIPIATVTNLRAALAGVGRIMDRNEDVLFLFITSHGDAAHNLAFDMPPLTLASLTPTALVRMLAASGIKWRVLVISACYSGGYVEPLKDANTLVITASDASHSSFGCAHGRDFTYFGQALFDESLPTTFSLAEAFAKAKQAVAAREDAEGLTPSSPQMFVGEAIAAQLESIEKRLAAAPR
jgi:hypothetical protein